MKKKIILILTAIILVLSTAIVCVACKDAKTVKFDKKMDAGEILSALIKTDIKNLTVETTNKKHNTVSTYYLTQHGYSVLREEEGRETSVGMSFYEDGKYYYMEKRSADDVEKYAISLKDCEIDKESVDSVKSEISSLLFSLYEIVNNNGKEKVTVRVENKNSFVIENEEEKRVFKDFNKTNLYIPKELTDYKTFETISTGNYIELEDKTGYEFRGLLSYVGSYNELRYRLKTYTIQPQFTKDGKTLPVKVANLSDNRIKKYIIPKSIEKVFFDYNAEYKEFCYLGTKAEWESKVTVEKKPYKDIVVKCSDGEVTVKKQATENP